MNTNYYKILGLGSNADLPEIKQAYRRLAQRFHPDRNPGDRLAEERFKKIQRAYEVLTNPYRRAQYDGSHNSEECPFPLDDLLDGVGRSFSDFFSRIFDTARASPQKGEDLQKKVFLSFGEAIRGTERAFEMDTYTPCQMCEGRGMKAGAQRQRCPDCFGEGHQPLGEPPFVVQQVCPRCHGTGEFNPAPCATCHGCGCIREHETLHVEFPPGVSEGTELRFAGKGEMGPGGPGDLVLEVQVEAHPYYDREGDDLVLKLPLTFPEATLGCTIPIQTLQGETLYIEVPPGTSHGKRLCVKGKGIAFPEEAPGDLYVLFQIQIPTELDQETRLLLQRLDQRYLPDPRPDFPSAAPLEKDLSSSS